MYVVHSEEGGDARCLIVTEFRLKCLLELLQFDQCALVARGRLVKNQIFSVHEYILALEYNSALFLVETVSACDLVLAVGHVKLVHVPTLVR